VGIELRVRESMCISVIAREVVGSSHVLACDACTARMELATGWQLVGVPAAQAMQTCGGWVRWEGGDCTECCLGCGDMTCVHDGAV
jgi:hypothetical protein